MEFPIPVSCGSRKGSQCVDG